MAGAVGAVRSNAGMIFFFKSSSQYAGDDGVVFIVMMMRLHITCPPVGHQPIPSVYCRCQKLKRMIIDETRECV